MFQKIRLLFEHSLFFYPGLSGARRPVRGKLSGSLVPHLTG